MNTILTSSSLADATLDNSISLHEVEDDCDGEDEVTLLDPEYEGVPITSFKTTDRNGARSSWSREALAEASRGVKDSTFDKYSRYVR